MNAISALVADLATARSPVSPATPDLDVIYARFITRADALSASMVKLADADALISEVAVSPLPDAVLKPIAAAIGKASGFDAGAYLKQMQAARAGPTLGRASGAQPVTGARNPGPAVKPALIGEILEQMAKAIERQIVCPPHAVVAIVLWSAGTYGFQGASIFPRLVFTSATKRCGKSTALATVRALVSKPVKADNVSASAMFRLVENQRPTLLIDEADTFVARSDDLRGVLNAGYECTGAVLRCVPTPDGKSFTEAAFNVYCPVALAGIGGLPDTVLDRSIVVRLERAARCGGGQRRRPMRYRELEKLRGVLAPQLVAYEGAIGAAVTCGVAILSRELSDRAQDNWEPLLAIADLAGGMWPQRARTAALALSGAEDAPSQREMLLADLHGIIGETRVVAVKAWQNWRSSGRKGAPPAVVRRIRSASMVGELLKMEHRPWPEYGKEGRGLTLAKLATLLRPFGIEPSNQRMPTLTRNNPTTTGSEVVRTYSVAALRVAFRKYLS